MSGCAQHGSHGLLLAAAMMLAACGDHFQEMPLAPAAGGTFSVLTYNVAGLPQGISGSHPRRNTPQISPKLNAYDLVLVQEDFCYHAALAAAARHAFSSRPEHDPGCTILFGPQSDVGDGLNHFSVFPFSDFERFDWLVCSGQSDCSSDCLTKKGFAVATHELAPGASVDVYNLHMDAGSCPGDLAARRAQVEQLLETLTSRSAGRALIVAGDTNLKVARPQDDESLRLLLESAGLVDACRAVECGDERIDRILLRSSASLSLAVEKWALPAEFVDAAGNDLSDHVPVLVRLRWSATAARR